jgi:hypothetical protein
MIEEALQFYTCADQIKKKLKQINLKEQYMKEL